MTTRRSDLIKPHQALFYGLILLVIMMSVQINFFLAQREQILRSRQMVEHSYNQIREIESAFTQLSNMEASQLAFLLTGNDRHLDVYQQSLNPSAAVASQPPVPNLHHVVGRLEQFYTDDVHEQDNLRDLLALLQQKITHMEKSLAIRRARGGPETDDWAHLTEGKRIMDDIRMQARQMVLIEEARLEDRIRQNEESNTRLTSYIVLAALFCYSALFAALLIITRTFSKAQKTERQLHSKEEWFRAAADGSIDGFFLFHAKRDAKGEITDLLLDYMNPVAQRMVQKTLGMVLSHSINDILYREDPDVSTFDIYKDICTHQKAMEREYTVTDGPLAGRTLQKQAVPLPNGIAVMCRDVTERKKMEQMKNEFVSTVSHELRTPLTSIRGSLGLVTGGVAGELSDQAKSLLMIAYNNCERLVRLINDILDIEKIEAGRMVFNLKAVEPSPALQQALKDNQGFAAKYGVSLVLRLPETPSPTVHVDADRLQQIMTNLVSNAVKFSPRGSQVELRCFERDGRVVFEVADHGQGIAPCFRDKIFQKFSQADSSDTRQKNGTGLGLAITRALVDQMNGVIGFDTQTGVGTVFHVSFPAVATQDGASPSSSVAPVESGEKPRILVCEDEADIANLLRLILEKDGFTVDIASTAQQAFGLLHARHYAAMTLDLILPDQNNGTLRDGLSFVQRLRSDAQLMNLPVIVVSAKADEGQSLVTGQPLGILDWLSKPIAVERLVELIRNLPASAQRPAILHVEDDNDIAHIVSLTLAPLADVTRAMTLQQARACMQQTGFDLVILDINLPDGLGSDLLPLLQRSDGRVTQVVLFTAADVSQDVSAQVAATLIKSRTSESGLLETIRQMVSQHNVNETRKVCHVALENPVC